MVDEVSKEGHPAYSSTTSPSREIAEKSLAAALAAVEIYNKPDFRYREESFSILMTNAWELLLKARFISINEDAISSIYAESRHEKGTYKRNRSGNPMTHGLSYTLERIFQHRASGLTNDCKLNIEALVEVRDNATHFLNKDRHLSRRIQEIGMASLSNYIDLLRTWFAEIDLERYNFFLMPIAFFHGFETVRALSISSSAKEIDNFLQYLSALEKKASRTDNPTHSITLPIETKIVKSRAEDAIRFRLTNDEDAPVVQVKEEDLLERYPYDYKELTRRCLERYENFKENQEYHRIRKGLEGNTAYCRKRPNNPKNPKHCTPLWSPEVFKVFDKRYTKRRSED
jgi:hypothetical protein